MCWSWSCTSYVNDVEYIVELANKESKISQQLKKIESRSG